MDLDEWLVVVEVFFIFISNVKGGFRMEISKKTLSIAIAVVVVIIMGTLFWLMTRTPEKRITGEVTGVEEGQGVKPGVEQPSGDCPCGCGRPLYGSGACTCPTAEEARG